METLTLFKTFFTDPKNAIATTIVFTAVASFGWFVPKKKLDEILASFQKWCEKVIENIQNVALSPMYGIGLMISKFIISKIGKSAGDAVEDVLSTLMIFTKGCWEILCSILFIPIVKLPAKMLERIMAGMFSDNAKKKEK